MLLEVGFTEYVESQRRKGADRLFPNLELYRDKWNVGYGKRFNRTFKRHFLKGYTEEQLTEKDVHSFRGTFISWFVQHKDLMSLPNVAVLRSIIGHYDDADISFLLPFLKWRRRY